MLFAGFNQHIAHHLFPTIDHYHLSKITPLVVETAKEFGIEYKCKNKLECMISISKAMIKRIPFTKKK
jgi:linoleoyl-CoA desaturase